MSGLASGSVGKADERQSDAVRLEGKVSRLEADVENQGVQIREIRADVKSLAEDFGEFENRLFDRLDQAKRESAEARRFNWAPVGILATFFAVFIGGALTIGASVTGAFMQKNDQHTRDLSEGGDRVLQVQIDAAVSSIERLADMVDRHIELNQAAHDRLNTAVVDNLSRLRWMQGQREGDVKVHDLLGARLDRLEARMLGLQEDQP